MNLLAGAVPLLLIVALGATGRAAPVSDPDARTTEPGPRLYTESQAEAGQRVYANSCAQCHGDHLQGTGIAPALAGAAFLKKVQLLDWSVNDLRNVVVTMMPRSDPGSLSPKQYAEVLAYLLAEDCLPAGQKAFPTQSTAELKSTRMVEPGVKLDHSSPGACAVNKQSKR